MAEMRQKAMVRGDIRLPQEQWRLKVIRALQGIQSRLDETDPSGAASGAGATGQTVGGAFGGVVVPNGPGFTVGTLVNYTQGQVRRADRTLGRRATHVVGMVSGGTAILYEAWARGPVRLDGKGNGDVVYLGTAGSGTLERPAMSDAGDVIDQVVGVRAVNLTSGLVACQVSIENRVMTV